MKKIIALSTMLFALACNSGETEDSTNTADSMVNSNTEVNQNENPMRAVDTTTNMMMDTANGGSDTTARP